MVFQWLVWKTAPKSELFVNIKYIAWKDYKKGLNTFRSYKEPSYLHWINAPIRFDESPQPGLFNSSKMKKKASIGFSINIRKNCFPIKIILWRLSILHGRVIKRRTLYILQCYNELSICSELALLHFDGSPQPGLSNNT